MNVVQIPRRFVRTDWGGTETVILETSKRLLNLGHKTEIMCPIALSDRRQETFDGVPVRRMSYFYPYLGLQKGARLQLDKKGGNLFSFRMMRELGRYPDLDLIHLHTMKRLGGIARYMARKRNIPYVVSIHGGAFDVPVEEVQSWTAPTRNSFEWGKILGWWVGSRRVLDDAGAIICVGQKEQLEIQKRYPNRKVHHLPNGVDLDHFQDGDGAAFRRKHNIPTNSCILLNIGRIDPQKNQLFMINLLPELLKDDPDIHLLLIGHVTNEAYADKIADAMVAKGLNKQVTLIRGISADSRELVDAYHAADIFVLPSVHEPFGIVILEAWAAGLPVVAARVGGIPSFVEDGKDGLLFESGDSTVAIRSIHRLKRDWELWHKIANAGKLKAQTQYSWDTITKRLVGIYEEVIDAHSLH